jgi:hypothetical protein
METPEKILKTLKVRLEKAIAFATKNNEDMDARSWGHEEGTLISFNEAKLILSKLEQK